MWLFLKLDCFCVCCSLKFYWGHQADTCKKKFRIVAAHATAKEIPVFCFDFLLNLVTYSIVCSTKFVPCSIEMGFVLRDLITLHLPNPPNTLTACLKILHLSNLTQTKTFLKLFLLEQFHPTSFLERGLKYVFVYIFFILVQNQEKCKIEW